MQHDSLIPLAFSLNYPVSVACPHSLISRIGSKLACNETEAVRAYGELLKFLALCASEADTLAPSKCVDEVWHEVILHTQFYATLCDRLFGGFIHHAPANGADEASYRLTLSLLNKKFGELDTRYWPGFSVEGAKCGTNCGSKCGSKCSD